MATAAGIDRDARAEELKRDNIVIRTYDLWKTYVMGDQEINAVSAWIWKSAAASIWPSWARRARASRR